jgi:hypothetical protein
LGDSAHCHPKQVGGKRRDRFSGEPEVYHAAGLNDAWTIGGLAERHD